MAIGKSRNHRARPAAYIEHPRFINMIKGCIGHEKIACAGFIPAGMKLDEAIIDEREYIIVAPPPQP